MNLLWSDAILADIRIKAQTGRAPFRPGGPGRLVPGFDDLAFHTPEGTAETLDSLSLCTLETTLGTRFAERPLELSLPVLIAPMGAGRLPVEAKVALARGSASAGTATGTGAFGMLEEERAAARTLIYQLSPGRWGFHPRDLARADAVEIYLGHHATAGLGDPWSPDAARELASLWGVCLDKEFRTPSRHGDLTAAEDLKFKVEELREATDWKIPIGVKVPTGRVREDVMMAARAGVDFVSIDGFQGSGASSPAAILDHSGISTPAAIAIARQALQDIGTGQNVDILAMGGIRHGADAAKALALGAKAVAIGTAALVALIGRRLPPDEADEGTDLVALCRQDLARVHPEDAAGRVARLLASIGQEMQILATAFGKRDIHQFARDDLLAVTPEAAAMTGLPLLAPAVEGGPR